MVAGKVKSVMGFHRSPTIHKKQQQNEVKKNPQPAPQPPSIADLLRIIHELQQRETRYQTELLDHRIVREKSNLVPSLEKENGRLSQKVVQLEVENEKLRVEVDGLRSTVRTEKDKSSSSNNSSWTTVRVTVADSHLRTVESTDPELRVPKPPPIPSLLLGLKSELPTVEGRTTALPVKFPAPPPPPPPRSNVLMGLKSGEERVRRVPEVVEFYHSLMRRDSRKDSGTVIPDTSSSAANTKNMIGEIENRSTHLLAIKTDVETQGDFVRFLIKEVEKAAFTNIEDVVSFVKWLDDELSSLVDERAVLKHFDWPEKKADAMREAAFGYNDLKKLEVEASSLLQLETCTSLKKMQTLLEKLEHGVYNTSRVRESAIKRYKGLKIPWDWMTEEKKNGIISQIKLASVKLATKFMNRVLAELKAVDGGSLEEEKLVLQGVRFAFRVHQFAGGFDIETMSAFQELKDKARSSKIHCRDEA